MCVCGGCKIKARNHIKDEMDELNFIYIHTCVCEILCWQMHAFFLIPIYEYKIIYLRIRIRFGKGLTVIIKLYIAARSGKTRCGTLQYAFKFGFASVTWWRGGGVSLRGGCAVTFRIYDSRHTLDSLIISHSAAIHIRQ